MLGLSGSSLEVWGSGLCFTWCRLLRRASLAISRCLTTGEAFLCGKGDFPPVNSELKRSRSYFVFDFSFLFNLSSKCSSFRVVQPLRVIRLSFLSLHA